MSNNDKDEQNNLSDGNFQQQNIGPNQEFFTETEETTKKNSAFKNKRMNTANKIVSKIIKKRLEKERPDDAKVMSTIKKDDILIIAGTYDRVEDIFDVAEIPYKLLHPDTLDKFQLDPEQILIINCPGNLNDKGVRNVKTFVEMGGYLFTTDWALLNVLEKAFPGYVKYNQKATGDDVVEIQIVDKNNPFLEMIMADGADPNWWLEGSSYPIKILDKEKVKVLLQSREMEKKYGESPIAIYFEYGKGKVFHITSHFYLQRAETRTNRQKSSSKEYFEKELSLNESIYSEVEEDLKEVNVSEVQSTYAMQQFITNIIIDRKKNQKNKK